MDSEKPTTSGIVPVTQSIGKAEAGSAHKPAPGQFARTAPGSTGQPNGPENANTEAVSGPPAPGGQVFAPDAGFLTANGAYDSHALELARGGRNPSPLAGRPYGRVTWRGIRQLVAKPGCTSKNLAPLVVLSHYVEHDGRTHEVQQRRGWFGGLAVDIDKGSPTLAAVVAAFRAATGGAEALVYSSSSAEPGNMKWRILVPLVAPIRGADYRDTQRALFGLLAREGIECDATLARAAQPVFLPNVSPKRRAPNGEPLFYRSAVVAGPRLDIVPGSPVYEAREALRAREAEEQRERAVRAAANREKRAARAATGDTFDPVEHFKATHTVAELLGRYGFVRDPKASRGSHWRSPLSTSGTYSTEDRGDHWVTVSAWAAASGIGRDSKSGNRWGDAWDLYVAFEHAGDHAAAVYAYAEAARPGWAEQQLVDLPLRIEAYETCRDPVPLDEWRRELEATVALEAERPGVKLLRGQPGCGKTYAVARAMAGKSGGLEPKARGVVSAPGHEFCGELVDELRNMGLDAAAYPKLDEHTCRNWPTAQAVQATGLPVTSCVCSGCPFKRECRADGYLAGVKEAERAAHKVVTHERLARSSERLTRDAGYVTIEEDPSKLLRPSVSANCRQLERFAALADDLVAVAERCRILDGWHDEAGDADLFAEFAAWGPPGGETGGACQFGSPHEPPGGRAGGEATGSTLPDEPDAGMSFVVRPTFFRALCDLAGELAKRCREAVRVGTPAGVHELELPALLDVPRNPEGAVWRALEQFSRAGTPASVSREALTLVLHAAVGRLERLYLQVDEDNRPGRPPARIVQVVGFWRTSLPWHRVPVFVNDGTLDAGTLEQLAGEPVVDVTPGGEIALAKRAEQYPVDILPDTSTAKVGRILAGIVRSRPECARVGVVMFKRHREELLFAEDGVPRLPPDVRRRIEFSTYYGSGSDRGSNHLHRHCDLVVVLGTFRPPPAEVRRALVRRGQVPAANATGTWGRVERRAGGPDGDVVTFGGRGYAEEQWAAAADGLTRAAVRQAVGRARAICPDGAAVVVVSTENAGVPVRPVAELPVLDERADAVLEAVARISETVSENSPPASEPGAGAAAGAPYDCVQKPYKTLYRENGRSCFANSAKLAGVTMAEILEAMPGVPYETARKWIRRAIDAGELERDGSTTATRYRLTARGLAIRPPALPPPEPPWLEAELAPARHGVTLSDVRRLHEQALATHDERTAWARGVVPQLVAVLYRHASEQAEARGQPPPPIAVVARHTVAWHAVTCGPTTYE